LEILARISYRNGIGGGRNFLFVTASQEEQEQTAHEKRAQSGTEKHRTGCNEMVKWLTIAQNYSVEGEKLLDNCQ
jgi:hypothetical protein